LKRIVLVATAVAMLIAATVAFAAATTPVNTYKATVSFSPSSSGTAKQPQKLAFTQKFVVTPGTSGNRTGLLSNITNTVYGVKVNVKGFPTCSIGTITGAGTDANCPKGALVAKGSIKAILGSSTDFTATGTVGPCNPVLDVWNAGQGKLAFFFVPAASGPHACLGGGIKVGQVGPYPGTYKQSGKNLVVDVPIPMTVTSTSQGLVGSLAEETLNWKPQTIKGVTSIVSVACQGNKRPYTNSFTASLPGVPAQTVKVSGSAPCKASK
jgi:hypothetical protein